MRFNPKLPSLPEGVEIKMQEPDYLEKNKLNPQEIKKEILSYLSNPLIKGIYKGQIPEYISGYISGYISEFISKKKLFDHKSKILENKFNQIEDLKNDLDKLDSASKEEALDEITKMFCRRMEVYLNTKKIDPFDDVIFDENQKPYFIKNSLFQVFFESPENRILIKKTIDEVFNKNSKETQTAQETGVVKQRVDEIEKRIRAQLTPGDVYGLKPSQASSRPPQVPRLDLGPISGTSYEPPPLAPRYYSERLVHLNSGQQHFGPPHVHPLTPRPPMPLGVAYGNQGYGNSMPPGVPFQLYDRNQVKTYPTPGDGNPREGDNGLPTTYPSETSASRVCHIKDLWL